jgi:hypothetical protein
MPRLIIIIGLLCFVVIEMVKLLYIYKKNSYMICTILNVLLHKSGNIKTLRQIN